MRLTKLFFVAVLLVSILSALTYAANYVPDELILILKNEVPSNSGISLQGFGDNIPDSIKKLNQDLNISSAKDVFKAPLKKKLRVMGSRIQPKLPQVLKIKLPPGLSIEQAILKYKNDPQVLVAEPNYINEIAREPSDPRYLDGTQWALNQSGDKDIDAPEAWDVTVGSSSVVIAIVDTGVDWHHEDLAANIWSNPGEIAGNGIDDDGNGYIDDVRGWDFVNVDQPGSSPPGVGEDGYTPDNDPVDYHGHGTHVAGISAAVTNNSIGVAGVTWNSKIMPVRSGYKGIDGGGWLENDDSAAAIQYAADNGANVINLSWGSNASSALIQIAVNYAIASGTVIVAAAGNSDNQLSYYPAAYTDVVAVAATNTTDTKASWSNYGSWIDICAPGLSIYSTKIGNNYGLNSGTSMASPVVSGVAALIFSQNLGLTTTEVISRLKSTADNIDALNPGYEGLLGTGRVNAFRAVGAPTITINHFPQNTLNTTTVIISGEATDAGSSITNVSIRINSGAWALATILGAGSTVSWSYNAGELADGTYMVEVRAVNGIGFTSAPLSYTFYVDIEATLPSTITIGSYGRDITAISTLYLSSNTKMTGQIQPTEHIAAAARPTTGLSTSGVLEVYNLPSSVNTETGNFTIDPSVLPEGGYLLDITISNYNWSDTRYLVKDLATVVENNGPAITDLAINGSTIFTGDSIPATGTITFTLADSSNVVGSLIALNIDGAGIANVDITYVPDIADAPSYAVSYIIADASALAGGTHTIWVTSFDTAGNCSTLEVTGLTVNAGEAKVVGVPLNYPNPFKPGHGEGTEIGYELTAPADITIYIYNIVGELVWKRTYQAGTMGGNAGYNKITWQGRSDFGEVGSNGIYFYRLMSGKSAIGKGRMTILD
ncbi:MAG: S8 family serine peptidase [bacterium]